MTGFVGALPDRRVAEALDALIAATWVYVQAKRRLNSPAGMRVEVAIVEIQERASDAFMDALETAIEAEIDGVQP